MTSRATADRRTGRDGPAPPVSTGSDPAPIAAAIAAALAAVEAAKKR